jgi:hypothetical protein
MRTERRSFGWAAQRRSVTCRLLQMAFRGVDAHSHAQTHLAAHARREFGDRTLDGELPRLRRVRHSRCVLWGVRMVRSANRLFIPMFQFLTWIALRIGQVRDRRLFKSVDSRWLIAMRNSESSPLCMPFSHLKSGFLLT